MRSFCKNFFLGCIAFLLFFQTMGGLSPFSHSHEEIAFAQNKADTINLRAPFPGQSSSISIKGKGAIDIMAIYVSQVYKFLLAVVSLFAVIMIMIGGYEYMFAGADTSGTENAKTRISGALLSLALVIMSALLLNFINPNFFKL